MLNNFTVMAISFMRVFLTVPDALLNGPSGGCFLLEYSMSPLPNVGSYGSNVAMVQTESR